MSTKLRSTFRIVGLLAGAVLILLTAGATWLAYSSHQAKVNVEAFCSSVSKGTPVDGLAQQARTSGLKVSELVNPAGESVDVMLVVQGVGFARHICSIEHQNGQVIQVERSFVD